MHIPEAEQGVKFMMLGELASIKISSGDERDL